MFKTMAENQADDNTKGCYREQKGKLIRLKAIVLRPAKSVLVYDVKIGTTSSSTSSSKSLINPVKYNTDKAKLHTRRHNSRLNK